MENINKEISKIEQNGNNEASKINETFNDIKNYVNQRRKYLLSQVQGKAKRKTKKLKKAKINPLNIKEN